MKKRLFEYIADELCARIEHTPGYVLPSIRQLTHEWRVSNTTMGKAIHLLADRGILSCMHGKRISLNRTTASAEGEPALTPSEERLFNEIRKGIVDGTYPPGEPLPKVSYFVISRHVSPDTVVRALAMLRERNLAHKRGKRWVAGPEPKSAGRGTYPFSPKQSGVVLLIAYHEIDWITFFEFANTRPFSTAFNTEISRHGIRAQLFFMKKEPPSRPHPLRGTAYASIDELKTTITCLGDSYLGTLFICHPDRISDTLPWIEEVCRLGKPVLYFDFSDQADAALRDLIHKRPMLFRLHLDNKRAISLAVNTLADLGHRGIWVPNMSTASISWIDERIRLIAQCARSRDPAMRVHTASAGNALWNMNKPGSIHYFITAVERQLASGGAKGPGGVLQGYKSQRQLLLASVPDLVSFFRSHSATAMIALNDASARQFYYWFRTIDIEIPNHVSMISFDNVPESITFPIATIDFGFSALGFQAAHILIGDLPYSTHVQRNIAAIPRLLDRGSLTAPGTGIPERLLRE